MSDELVYRYDPDQAGTRPLLAEGATAGWVILRNGDGTGRAVRAVALTDADGNGFIEQAGEWEDVTITDDRHAGNPDGA